MASDWLKKRAEEQAKNVTQRYGEDAYGGTKWREEKARDNGKLSQSPKRENKGIASDWLRNKAREQEAQKEQNQTHAAPQNLGGKRNLQVAGKFDRRQLGDDLLPTGTPKISEKMQRYEAAQAAQTRADMAQREYDDYVASTDYQAYLQEQRVKQARQSAMLMPNAQPMVPGVEAKNPGGADPRVDKAKELKAKAGHYAAEAQKARDTQILGDDMEEFETWSKADQAALQMYVVQRNQELGLIAQGLPYVSADQQSSALIDKYGIDKVRQMAESYSRWENEKQSKALHEQAKEFADKHPYLSSGASVVANAMGNFSGITGYATEAGGRTGRYSTMDPNNLGTMPGVYAGAIRGKVAEKIAGDQYDAFGNQIKDGGVLRQAGATLYEAGMSAADNVTRMAMGGRMSMGLAAMGSFGQTMKEASAKGASPGQAVLLATASAGLEVLTEKVSLDNLLKQAAAGKKSAKEIVKNMLIQGGVEISEEEMSFLGNLLADAAIMREKSGYSQHIGQLMAQGMKYEDAKEQASKALWEEAANTAVISGLSGGMMSGGTSMINNAVHGLSDWAARKAEGKPQADIQEQTEDTAEDDAEVPGLSLPTPGVTIETKEHVDHKTVAQAGRLSKATGREIVFYTQAATQNGIENGFYKDGKIYVNTKSKNPIAQIVSHELTHGVEFADAYQDLSKTVFAQIERMGADLQSLRQQKAALYERNGHALKNQAAVDQEIVAEFVEQYLLTNEQMILDVANNNRTLGQRVLGWIDNLLAKLGDERAQERKFLNNARNLWAKALEQSRSGQIQQQTTQAVVARNKTVQSQQAAQTEESDGGAAELLEWARGEFAAGRMTDEEFDSIMDIVIQQDEMEGGWVEFSYAGVNARNADLKTLNAAQHMEKQGVANETIRQQTGWFKGMDGKWRFEVDDSSARISDEVSNYMTLGQLLKDADILKEYPNLEDVSVVFQSLDPGVNASYNAQFDTIDVNYNLKNDPEAILGAVLHEVQHVVQRWEGFTKGSTVGAWDRKIKAGFDSRRGADIRQEREASQELRRIQEENPEFYRDMMQLHDMLPDSPRGEVDFDTLEQISEDPPEWQAYDARLEELEAIYGDTTVWDFNHLLYTQERASNREGRTATELYWDTAGEIEARDVAARRNLDAEGRKKTPPRLGDEDTVFADDTGIAFDQNISEYPYNMQTVIRDYIDAVDKDVLSFIEEVQTGAAWPGKRVTVGKVSAKMAQKITELTGVENNEGNPIILNSGAVEHIIKRHGAKGEADRSMRNNLDIARINYVLQNFDAAELSGKKSFGYRNRNGSPSQNVIFSKKINGTYFVIEAVPDTGKTGIVSAFINKNGASQVLDDNAPSSDVRNVPASTPNESVPEVPDAVKGKRSISGVDKRGIASDLRSILSRGGDPAELRRYIDQLEHSGGRAEQTGRNAEQSGAQRIIQEARRSGTSVQEYLQENWEQYDVDGQWNEDARQALDLERQGRRYSISDTDNQGRKLTEDQQRYFEKSQARTEDGRLMILYHQTDNDFTVFDARREGAGKRDNATPFGIFLKSSPRNIGLKGNKQMPLYANITKPLVAQTRDDLVKKIREMSPEYDQIQTDIQNIDAEYHEKFESAKKALRDYMIEWRAKNKEASRTALYEDPTFNQLYEAEDNVIEEWGNRATELDTRAKTVITNALRGAGYDGVFLENDSGSFGRSTDAFIALDPEQVKNIDNENPTTNPDIRYSISENGEDTEKKTAEQIREEMPAKAKSYLAGAEKKLLDGLGQKLGVSKFQNREQLQEIVREIADEYLTEGRIRDEQLEFLFDRAYAEGVVQDWSFYNEHKEIKDHLRTTGVTLSKQDQADIADFNDFRKRAFNTVKIVNNGLPVDSAYHELHEMAPALFPESITHPADQLVRMYEVGRSIQVAEMGLRKFYGEDAENHRQWARYNFADTVNEVIQDLRSVRRVAEEAARKQAEAKAPTTAEEAAEYYKQLKDARKTYEKARAKNLLTESDEIQVGRLLRGEILPEHLDPENDNIRAITNVFEAKQEYERLTKLIAEYKAHIRAQRREAADKILESAPEWKDKKVGIAYSRETMERNIYDIVPDKDVAEQVNEAYFRPVHDAEANAVRFKNEHRDLVRKLDLSRKVTKGNLVSEAHAVQLLGEAEDNIRVLQNSRGRMKQRDGKTIQEWQAVIDDMWAQSPGLDQAKIRRAVAEFRKIYDKLFQQMNEVRIRNGYEPVNYRQGYFPHFQPGDGDGVLAHFGKVLGIDTQVAALPTTINGLTHTFRPGIQWFGNAQERLGFNTAYDAVEGFDKYLEGVSSVIFQTDNIQNLRALESQIRYRTTDEGIRKQVDAVNADTRLTEEEKQIKINAIYEHGRYTLSNFVVELTEYTNLLANKKSKLDRTMEGLIGRRLYTIMKNWESRVGANMIAGNISSAMTNFIPITQASAQLSSDSLIRGMWGTLKSYKEDDGIPGMSTFLTNRRGSDPLVKTWAQTASEKMGMNLLMNLVDGFTSDTIVRAAYYQNLKNGLSEAEAMHQADIFAASVMADRSKGSMPTLFESTNPVFKMFTQFQLEVNNQFSEIFKDLPRRYREKGLAVMMGVLLKYFIGAFLYNELYEFFAGRRPALDPLSMLNNAVGDMTGYELPNVIEWISGDADFETQKVGAGQAAKNLASTALGELPFSSGLTLLGIETDGGRLPASSAIPDLTALWDAATTEGWSSEKRWKEAKDELGKLMYVVPPFGGNQIQKTWKGVKAYMEGGSYNVDKDGNDILQYPVFKSNPEDAFWNLVRASFLGKSSLPEAQDWVDSGFDSLGSKQTAAYQDMVDAGVNDRDAYALLRELEGAAKTETKSRNTVQREILAASKVSDVGKAIVYYGVLADDAEKGFMDKLADAGIDQGEIGRVAMELKNANTLKDKDKKVAQMNAVANAKMSEEEKKLLVGKVVGYDLQTESGNPTEYAKFLSAYDRGLSADEYMKMRAEGADIDDFLEVTDAGVSSDTAVKYAMSMVEMAAKEDTSKLDKWRLSVNFSNKASDQLALLSLVMTDAQFAKVDKANTFGVKPSTYVELQEILPKFDANGNGTYTQKEAKAAIDSMNISTAEKAVLWQLMNAGWKARNNPFDKKIGQQIEDSMGE